MEVMKTYTAHAMRDWSVLTAQMKTLLMEYATEKVCHLYQLDCSIMQLITCNDIRIVYTEYFGKTVNLLTIVY